MAPFQRPSGPAAPTRPRDQTLVAEAAGRGAIRCVRSRQPALRLWRLQPSVGVVEGYETPQPDAGQPAGGPVPGGEHTTVMVTGVRIVQMVMYSIQPGGHP
jgi:hypothetical protein